MSIPSLRTADLFETASDHGAIRFGYCRCDAHEQAPLVDGKCGDCWERKFGEEEDGDDAGAYGCSTPGCSNLPPVGERDCDACMLASLDQEIEARLADVRAEQVSIADLAVAS